MKNENPKIAIHLSSLPTTSEELYEVISAEAVVVRADLFVGKENINRISLVNGIKIFSLKSVQEGGRFNESIKRRHMLLLEALENYDVIELEMATDLIPEILRMIPAERRIISWQGKAASFVELESRYRTMIGHQARYYQLVLDPDNISQGIWPIQLIKKYSDHRLISYARGASGLWTQLLSVFMHSPMIFGKINKHKSEEVFLTIEQLKEDYNLPTIRNVKQIYGIAGNPVFSSLSPLIHNKCYDVLGIDAVYLPFHIDSFDDFWKFISIDFPVSGLDFILGGFTMVSPFKEESFKAAKGHLCDPTLDSKACNILINNNGEWYSDSSDGLGVLAALAENNIEINGLKVAIIGCGGAGRTIASRLKSRGAEIIFYNRSENRGKFASRLLDLPYSSIEKFDASNYDVVINATPVGKHGKKLIYDPVNLKPEGLAIDMAYTKDDTLLVSKCREHGKNIVEGKQILLKQVKKQFTGLTGYTMPLEVENVVRHKTQNLLKVD